AAEAVLAQSLADSLKTVIEKGGDFAALARQYSSDTGSAMNGGDLGWFGRGMMVKPFEEAAFSNKTGQITIANSQFGIHIIQTTRRGVETKQYQIAYLVRNVVPSTQTYQNTYAIASKFVSENTDKAKFDAAVEEQKLTKKVATLRENDREIAGLDNPRPLVRAAFEAEKGNILKSTDGSPIFEFGDNFVVGTLVEATQEGIAPFTAVRDRVELAVRKEKKGELLAEKIKTAAAGKTDLFDIAQTLGTTVQSASNVNFNSFSIPGVGVEPAVIGTVASIEPNVVPAPVKGNNAVFLVKVSSVTEGTDTDLTGEKNRLAQSIGYRAGFQAYDAHQKAVEIVDKRAKFY
ncbi:MAG TPA: peptidylprolyl isomerase, partial [Prolixibacteraceae bacterium]|nr:peptidylprolyl isomerase [Prolixibacteraceae bacterium]